jgi:hypothetical protein
VELPGVAFGGGCSSVQVRKRDSISEFQHREERSMAAASRGLSS